MRRIANVYKDKTKNTWFYSATLGVDRFGERIQRSKKGFTSQREAKEALEEARRNFKESEGVYLKGIKFKDYFDKYFFPWYKLGTVEKTYMKTENALKRAIVFFGNMQVENIRPIHIQEFQQYLATECFIQNKDGSRRNLSNNYIKQIFNKLRVVFQRAKVLEVIKENPVDSIGKIRTERPVIDFWTYEDFKRVYQTSYLCDYYEVFYKRMMRFLFVTGLRSEELFALKWEDIDFSKMTCDVNKSLYIKTRTDYEFSETKNRSSIRTIALDQKTVQDLESWRKEQEQIGEIEFVFSFDGLPPSPKTFRTRIQKLAVQAGVKPITLHGLRHSHVAFLIEHNKNIYAVSKRLGHSSIKTTLDKYGHLYPETHQQLADEFTRFNI